MELNRLGEFGLIDLINIPHPAPESVLVGIGDDCAVLPYSDSHYQLISCDLLVEDVHFIGSKISAYQLGYKAVAVNLSDVAAMGGKPSHILLSAALPPDYTVEQWKELYRGIGDICRKYGVNLIGGDTTSSKDKLTINVTVIGLVEQQNLHLRSAAKEGDAVFVTGPLGGSRAGLELVLNPQQNVADEVKEPLLFCHYQPEPCCNEIQVLNQLAGTHLHALNDISDGLVSECYEIAEASNVSIVLQKKEIPVHPAAKQLAEQTGADSLRWALTGGEDYQLAGTMDAAHAAEICAAYEKITGKPLTIIGKVEAGDGVYLQDELERRRLEKKGYNHFSESPQRNHGQNVGQNTEAVSLLLEQIAQMKQQAEQQAIYRHDLKNHLGCLMGLLECGEAQKAEAYLRQMLQSVPEKQMVQYHSREILNILCNQKAKLAQEQNIEFQFHNAAPEKDLLAPITDYDLCILAGNLLDNGLEHAAGVEDPYLYLDLYADAAGKTVLRMENSCQTPPVLQNGILTSCKADAASHGKGMQQIQRIAEAYGGTFAWQYDNELERFITQCIFPGICPGIFPANV